MISYFVLFVPSGLGGGGRGGSEWSSAPLLLRPWLYVGPRSPLGKLLAKKKHRIKHNIKQPPCRHKLYNIILNKHAIA